MVFITNNWIEFTEKYWTEDIKRDKIRRILSGISDKKYDIVLDIGCGSGGLTTLLDSELSVDYIYGIDISEEAIELAKQNHMKDNTSYITQDFGVEFDCLAPELRALEGKVSLIFSNSVFTIIHNSTNLAQNIYRLLSKGGEVYASLNHRPEYDLHLTPEEMTISEKVFVERADPEIKFNRVVKPLKAFGFDVIFDTNLIELKVDLTLNDFKQMILPMRMSSLLQQIVETDEEKLKILSKRLEEKLIAILRQFTDETTGEVMVEFAQKHRILRLRKP